MVFSILNVSKKGAYMARSSNSGCGQQFLGMIVLGVIEKPRRMNEIIERLPETEVAKEAAELLKKIR
jgi:hypothetical protein